MVFSLFSSIIPGGKQGKAGSTESPVVSPDPQKISFEAVDGAATKDAARNSTEPRSPEELLTLIRSIPAKLLHHYVVSHLPNVSQQEFSVMSKFFATLEPPPKLHCVRCHKGFVEVENDDRSCLVPHDDASTEVEYVGAKASSKAVGSTYETIWGCCAKTVEGNGDQGPPDGWCYEGKHTTDAKRARFRADSTIHDDKLVSCEKLRCFSERSEDIWRRKKLQGEEVSDEDGDHSEQEREEKRKMAKRKRNSSPSRRKALVAEGEGPEAEGSETASVTASTTEKSATSAKGKSKVQHMKRKSVTTLKQTTVIVSTLPPHDPAPSPSAHHASPAAAVTPAHAPSPPTKTVADVANNGGGSPSPKAAAKKPKRPRKSAPAATDGGKYKPPKEDEGSDDDEYEEEKPKKRRRKPTTA